jgi:hypothetical protein
VGLGRELHGKLGSATIQTDHNLDKYQPDGHRLDAGGTSHFINVTRCPFLMRQVFTVVDTSRAILMRL